MLHGDDKPDCSICLNIEKESVPVYKLYNKVKNQHIIGFGGPVSLNLNSLYELIPRVGIEDDEFLRCVELVEMLYHQVRLPQYAEEKRKAEFLKKAGYG